MMRNSFLILAVLLASAPVQAESTFAPGGNETVLPKPQHQMPIGRVDLDEATRDGRSVERVNGPQGLSPLPETTLPRPTPRDTAWLPGRDGPGPIRDFRADKPVIISKPGGDPELENLLRRVRVGEAQKAMIRNQVLRNAWEASEEGRQAARAERMARMKADNPDLFARIASRQAEAEGFAQNRPAPAGGGGGSMRERGNAVLE